jgi:hypothetical protein
MRKIVIEEEQTVRVIGSNPNPVFNMKPEGFADEFDLLCCLNLMIGKVIESVQVKLAEQRAQTETARLATLKLHEGSVIDISKYRH